MGSVYVRLDAGSPERASLLFSSTEEAQPPHIAWFPCLPGLIGTYLLILAPCFGLPTIFWFGTAAQAPAKPTSRMHETDEAYVQAGSPAAQNLSLAVRTGLSRASAPAATPHDGRLLLLTFPNVRRTPSCQMRCTSHLRSLTGDHTALQIADGHHVYDAPRDVPLRQAPVL